MELTCLCAYAYSKIHYYETFEACIRRVVALPSEEDEDAEEREQAAERCDIWFPAVACPQLPIPRTTPNVHTRRYACAHSFAPLLPHAFQNMRPCAVGVPAKARHATVDHDPP